MQVGKRAWNMHVRQSDFAKNSVKAAGGKRQFLATPAQISPASVPVLKIGSLRAITAGIDAHDLEVFHLQVEISPGIANATSEIKNPLHRKHTKKRLGKQGSPLPSDFRAIEGI
jgi:hypothetical protein